MKRLITIVLLILMIFTIVSCNMQVVDTTYSFERAIIFLPNGEKIEGPVESWGDYENSDMIQVKINGKTYLTHSSNVILISE